MPVSNDKNFKLGHYQPAAPVRCGQRVRASEADTGSSGTGAARLRAANASTSIICSLEIPNQFAISSMVAPASRFSNTAETGIRVSRNTHAPLSLPGTLSTAGHCDQSRAAMFRPRPILAFCHLRAQASPARRDGADPSLNTASSALSHARIVTVMLGADAS